MKHLKSYLPILALSATLALTACSSDELPADPSFDQDIKTLYPKFHASRFV